MYILCGTHVVVPIYILIRLFNYFLLKIYRKLQYGGNVINKVYNYIILSSLEHTQILQWR